MVEIQPAAFSIFLIITHPNIHRHEKVQRQNLESLKKQLIPPILFRIKLILFMISYNGIFRYSQGSSWS